MTEPVTTPRTTGRSTTRPRTHGKKLILVDPIDKGYVCEKLCDCHEKTNIVDKLGRQLKQRCVTARIQMDEEVIGQLAWRYKAEVGYYMGMPARPLMSKDQPNRPSRFPLGRLIGEGLSLRDLEGKMQKGMLRIPDLTILKVTGIEIAAMRATGKIDWKRFIPVQRNIEKIVEIKFPGDTLSMGQIDDYPRIAGEDAFVILELSDCDCRQKRRQAQTEPVRVPVTTPVKKEDIEARKWFHVVPQPALGPAPVPIPPRYGPSLPANTGSMPLPSWLRSAAKVGEVVLVGVIAIGVVAVAVAALPVEAAAAVVLVVIVAPVALKESRNKKEEPHDDNA